MTAGLPDKIAKPVHEKLIGRNTQREKIIAELYYQYLKTLVKIKAWKLNRKHEAPIKPLELIYVDPSEIRKAEKNPVKNNFYPYVKDGDWDENLEGITQASNKFGSLKQRFEEGRDWKETDFFKRRNREVEKGKTQYAKNTDESFNKKLEKLDQLYESINEEGYKKQTELQNPGMGVNNKINHHLKEFNEVTIHLGKNGELIFGSGSHRIEISIILGLEEIPVRVSCRHKKWQEKRNIAIKNPEKLSEEDRNHPDIKQLKNSSSS